MYALLDAVESGGVEWRMGGGGGGALFHLHSHHVLEYVWKQSACMEGGGSRRRAKEASVSPPSRIRLFSFFVSLRPPCFVAGLDSRGAEYGARYSGVPFLLFFTLRI